MSLDKAIQHGKERRKLYHGCKSFDPACRNHGGCPACEKARKLKHLRRKLAYGGDGNDAL